MFAYTRTSGRFADYSVIVDPQPEGAVIGYFAGKPISEQVVDMFGRHFTYVGVASCRRDGDFDVDHLRAGEFIAEPGLVYRLVTGNSGDRALVRRAA
jgi:hypothetical protein